MKKGLLFVVTSAALLTACEQTPEVVFNTPPVQGEQTSSSAMARSSSSVEMQEDEPAAPAQTPNSVFIDVPFSSQAPHANWDDPYQEACEEISLIMAKYFLEEKTLNPDSADKEILDLVAYETSVGLPYDVTIAELAKVAEDHYGLTARIETDVTVESIKKELATGNPVIIPAAGRDLGNPYFSGEGPWYHMLIIVGYDGKNFITNDPGTRRGEGYKYSYETLVSAIHDWTGVKEEIRNGKKAMLIVTK